MQLSKMHGVRRVKWNVCENNFKMLTIFAKCSILDIWLSFEKISDSNTNNKKMKFLKHMIKICMQS